MNEPEKEPLTAERAKRKPMKIVWRTLNVAAILILIAAGYVGFRVYRLSFAPIDVENATKTEAISWLTLRDFSEESPETRADLVNFYLDKLSDKENGEGKARKDEPEKKFVLSPKLKNIAHALLLDSDSEILRWDEVRNRPSYFRIDYVVKRESDAESVYVLSTDIKPTAALLARRQEAIDAAKNSDQKLTKFEKNIQTLLLQCFLEYGKTYDSTSDANKERILEVLADRVLELQDVYVKLRAAGGAQTQTRAELLRSFEKVCEGWYAFAAPEELACGLWFKDVVVSVIVAREFGMKNVYPPKLPVVSGDSESQTTPSGVLPTLQGFAEKALKWAFPSKSE